MILEDINAVDVAAAVDPTATFPKLLRRRFGENFVLVARTIDLRHRLAREATGGGARTAATTLRSL